MFNLNKHREISIQKQLTKDHILTYLFWECTTRCNLACLHCGSDCKQSSTYPDMPLHDFVNALDTIKEFPPFFTVVITGGEPLLRQDLETCGKEIRKRGMRWSIVSNGLLYTKERQSSLLAAGMGALTISLDGLEGSHNWLRGTYNSFKHVSNAISLASKSSRLTFDVVTCVNQKNISELEDIYQFLLTKNVKAWRLFNIVPIGRAINYPKLFLDNEQFKILMNFIVSKRSDSHMKIQFSCEGYVGKYEKKVRDNMFFCRAGINIGSVLFDGSISACPNNDRSLAQGNIYTDNLWEVWNNKYEIMRNRSWTKKGKCEHCKEYKYCKGSGLHNWHDDMENVLVCHAEKCQ